MVIILLVTLSVSEKFSAITDCCCLKCLHDLMRSQNHEAEKKGFMRNMVCTKSISMYLGLHWFSHLLVTSCSQIDHELHHYRFWECKICFIQYLLKCSIQVRQWLIIIRTSKSHFQTGRLQRITPVRAYGLASSRAGFLVTILPPPLQEPKILGFTEPKMSFPNRVYQQSLFWKYSSEFDW